MNRVFKVYFAIWVIAVVLFNVFSFAIPGDTTGKFSESFWIGYVFIFLAHIGLLICCYHVFLKVYLKELFYNIPIVAVGYIGLIAMTTVGSLAMTIEGFPTWLGIILCFGVLGATAAMAIVAGYNAQVMKEMDAAQSRESYSIREITSKSEVIMNTADDPQLKKIARDVYSELRYSDPVSNIMLSNINSKISDELSEFEEAIINHDLELAEARGEELINTIKERNSMCKDMK